MAVNTLISAFDLSQLEGAVIVDCRSDLMNPDAGFAAYSDAHIPNALFADLNKDLSSAAQPGVTGRHPLPDPVSFQNFLSELGVNEDSPVVAYDADTGAYAARLWWLLRSYGHEKVWVLDGGLEAWLAVGGDTTDQSATSQSAKFVAKTALTQHYSVENIADTAKTVLDARAEIRFRGEQEPIDPVAGHIPGATCFPFQNNLDDRGYFKPADELRTQFTAAGVSPEKSCVCYCGSGVTACHNILALLHAGFPEPILYPGSWSEWITDTSRPIATIE